MYIEFTENWNRYLEKFPEDKQDIYFEEVYVKLYEDESGTALAVVCKEDEKIMLMPFIRKRIGKYYDFETAYGYGGPIFNTNDTEWIKEALMQTKEYMARNNYICGFIRFHTLLENAEVCRDVINVIFDRRTIAIDTSVSEEEIWLKQINSKNRNMIRKAEKNGLVYKAEYDFQSLHEFIELYNATMNRLNADEFYYFGEDYYGSIVEKMKGKAFLGTVRKDGKLLCGAIFMYSKDYGHYHLEGSNHQYSGLGANNLLLWKTAVEFHNLGVKEFHLGGGYNAQEDNSLYKFKKAFSTNNKKFYIGKMIFNEEKYKQLTEEWSKNNPDKVEIYGKLLLCYRY